MAVLPPTPAQALTMPDLQWSEVALSSTPSPSHLVSQADGGVTVGCSSSGGTTSAFVSFSSAGSTVQDVPTTDSGLSYLSACSDSVAVGSDGSVYVYAYDTNQSRDVLAKYSGDSLEWTYTPPCSYFGRVTVGANGNIYMDAWGGSCSNHRLIGVEPTLDVSETEPDVVANTQLPREVLNNGISPYSSGLVLRYNNGFGFYEYDGTYQDELNMTVGIYDSQPFARADNGWAYVSVKESSPPTACSSNYNAIASIDAYGLGGQIWSYELPDCSEVHGVRPTYSGGAVALVDPPDSLLADSYLLYAISGDGSETLWAMPLPFTNGNDTYYSTTYAVDMNGNVAVQRQFLRDEGGPDYPGVQFFVVSGFSGATIWSGEFYGNASDGHGFCLPSGGSVIPAIANDTWYVALAEGNGYGGCSYSTTSLYAVEVPGLTMDYPRGAVLDDGEPWLDVVVLGDSYSSGEGVEPFITGTDTSGPPANGCHRSEKAYARLLDNSPALRWSLTGFVACSGAKTENITTTGQYNEGAQVAALDTSIDVVVLSIGGNDIEFETFATACVTPFNNCSDGEDDDVLDAIETDLPDKLDDAYAAIAGEINTSTARALVLGYPMLVADGVSECVLEDSGEVDAAQAIITALNEAIEDAVDRAGGPFEYVDPTATPSPFTGHELCASGSYFNAVVAPPNMEYSFHPNDKGQDAYRQVIVDYLTSN
jgi:hypothetical protein